MTVSYTAQVSSCRRFGCFWKLLFRWKGSIYKLLWPNLMVYVMLYSSLSFAYRFLLSEEQRTVFEKLSLHCQTYSDLIPVSFVLGFYVSIVIKRWWDQYLCIPWPDPLAVFTSAFVLGQDERARLMRRTIMRYANLSLVITLRMMCPTVKKRFPTVDHMVEAGFMLPNEKKIFENLELKTIHPKYWLPLVWATAVITRARREGKVKDDFALKTLIDEINKFRGGCGGLLSFDWISIPLVYTQVVTLAVYTYFTATLMGNQYLNPTKGYSNHTIDLVIPIFTLLQFFFYMGWLLVAETLVNPFGEDDDDFEVNWLIDRNLQISYVIVDEMHEEHPELLKDQYWDEVFPTELPYTEAAKQYYMEPFLGSTMGVDVPRNQQAFVTLTDMTHVPEKPVEAGERKETTPMRIGGVAGDGGSQLGSLLSSQVNTVGFSSSNSILSMLKKNIYGDDSKKSLSSSISLNMKKKWRPFTRSSQTHSANSGYKPNFDDYQEEVFRMSDISNESSHLQGSKISSEKEMPKGDTEKIPIPQRNKQSEGYSAESSYEPTIEMKSYDLNGIAGSCFTKSSLACSWHALSNVSADQIQSNQDSRFWDELNEVPHLQIKRRVVGPEEVTVNQLQSLKSEDPWACIEIKYEEFNKMTKPAADHTTNEAINEKSKLNSRSNAINIPSRSESHPAVYSKESWVSEDDNASESDENEAMAPKGNPPPTDDFILLESAGIPSPSPPMEALKPPVSILEQLVQEEVRHSDQTITSLPENKLDSSELQRTEKITVMEEVKTNTNLSENVEEIVEVTPSKPAPSPAIDIPGVHKDTGVVGVADGESPIHEYHKLDTILEESEPSREELRSLKGDFLDLDILSMIEEESVEGAEEEMKTLIMNKFIVEAVKPRHKPSEDQQHPPSSLLNKMERTDETNV